MSKNRKFGQGWVIQHLRATVDAVPATARLVLVNIPEPQKFVSEMAALVRPGGVVALHEADWIAHECDPPLPVWDRLRQVLDNYAEAKGMDLYVGRRIGPSDHRQCEPWCHRLYGAACA